MANESVLRHHTAAVMLGKGKQANKKEGSLATWMYFAR